MENPIEQEIKDSITKKVYAFIEAMNNWEKACLTRQERNELSIDEQNRINLQEVEKIFDAYCTERETSTFRSASFQNPPEYDPETEILLEVEKITKKKYRVYTQQTTGFKSKCRYTVQYVNDELKLSKKESQGFSGDWRKKSL